MTKVVIHNHLPRTRDYDPEDWGDWQGKGKTPLKGKDASIWTTMGIDFANEAAFQELNIELKKKGATPAQQREAFVAYKRERDKLIKHS